MTTKKEASAIPYAERVKIIRERLKRARYKGRLDPLPKSAKVLAAEKVIEEWEDRNNATYDAQRAKHDAKVREIEDAMILGDGEKVVKLLNALGV